MAETQRRIRNGDAGIRSGRCQGFTLIELLISISIISVLIAILLPALSRARSVTRIVQCASQMRQIGIGMHTYANDHGNMFPVTRRDSADNLFWTSRLLQTIYGHDDFRWRHYESELMNCPEYQPNDDDVMEQVRAYGVNTWISHQPSGQHNPWMYDRDAPGLMPSVVNLVGEINYNDDYFRPPTFSSISSWPRPESDARTSYRMSHASGSSKNYLFVDGHVEGRPEAYVLFSNEVANFEGIFPSFNVIRDSAIWRWW